jgi:phage baseplate assembly protein W|tara:strand:- start:547 stop:1038 length:492 start_codon:yes stop_codon:yes gene_type:complete
MAIKDTSRKPYIQDNDTNVKVGIDLPIRRGSDKDGFFASTSTTIEAVKNNIRNLLQTNEGERFFQPNLGLNLRRLLFEHITNENLIGIQDSILDKIEFWLPFVEVRDIQVLSRDDTTDIGVNEIRVKILFNIKQDPNTLDSITLDFSSDITESESNASSGGGY